MSDTIRKRREKFETYYKFFLEKDGYWAHLNEKEISQQRAKYYSKTQKWYTFGLPQPYRNCVNRMRRAHDKHEMWKELNFINYAEQCSKWNCKDSKAWGYW